MRKINNVLSFLVLVIVNISLCMNTITTYAMKTQSNTAYVWDQKEIPHKGWTWVNVEDLGEPTHTCEMCGHPNIRYVHKMNHPEYQDELQVGCECASKMTDEYTNNQLTEKENKLKSKALCKTRWPNRVWKISSKGTLYLNSKKINVSVFKYKKGGNLGKWGFKVEKKDGNIIWSNTSFNTLDEAKIASFEEYWKLL